MPAGEYRWYASRMNVKGFPDAVRRAMRAAGAGVTCLPVQLERSDWETAFFFHLAGHECKRDRQVLANARTPLPIGIEADLLELPRASVVVIRVEVLTAPEDPLAAEVLLTPGGVRTHFDALQLLSQQERLCWFFADEDFRLIYSQQSPLGAEQRRSFDDLLRDAVRHDALIRASARYDAAGALAEVQGHYTLRPGLKRGTDRNPGNISS